MRIDVPSIYLDSLYEYLIENGHSLSDLIIQFRTQDIATYSLSSTVPYSLITQVIDYISETDDSQKGIIERLTPYFERALTPLMASVILPSQSIRSGIESVIKYTSVIMPLVSLQLIEVGAHSATLQFKNIHQDLMYSNIFHALSRYSFHNLIYHHLFAKNLPDDSTASSLLNLTLINQDDTLGIKLSLQLLEFKPPLASPAIHNSIKNQLERSLAIYSARQPFHIRIKHIINHHLINGEKITLNGVSEKLHLSPRSVSRSLSNENYTFQQCLDECLFMRMNDLSELGLAKKEVAYKLGFKSIAGMYSLSKRYLSHKKNISEKNLLNHPI